MILTRHYGEPEKSKIMSDEDNLLIGLDDDGFVRLNFRGRSKNWYSLQLNPTEVRRLVHIAKQGEDNG